MSVRKLPHWSVTDKFPAFYDTESATAIEMVAKLYGSMNDVITDYNKFVDDTNKIIDDFENGIITDFDTFKVAMSQQFQDFIDVVELKLGAQDKEITEAVDYMKDSIEPTITKLVADMKDSGELDQTVLKAVDDVNVRVDETNTKVDENTTDIEELNSNLEQTNSSLNSVINAIGKLKVFSHRLNGGKSITITSALYESYLIIGNSNNHVVRYAGIGMFGTFSGAYIHEFLKGTNLNVETSGNNIIITNTTTNTDSNLLFVKLAHTNNDLVITEN